MEKQGNLHRTTDKAACAQISLYHERGGIVKTESEVLRMNARKITDVTADLVYLVDNAQGICKALYEVGSFDDLVDPDDMDNSKLERFMKAYEVLRMHNTCGRLVCSLSDILDSIAASVGEIDEATVEKPAGIQDTEMLCTAICPQRMKPDGIQTEKRTPPETCAEPQKKGKSGGAQK